MLNQLFLRRVRRCKIVFEANTYYSRELAGMEGAEVMVRPGDGGILYVQDWAGRFVCHAAQVANAAHEALS